MKTIALALISLLLCGRLIAAFSAFEIITPDFDSKDYHPTVSYREVTEGKNLITILNVKNHAWLVVCSEPKKETEKEFRAAIWGLNVDHNYLRESWGMNPEMEQIDLISPLQAIEGKIEIHLSDDLASRAYVVIDYASPVDDGGFYYTVDIPEFNKQKGANQTE